MCHHKSKKLGKSHMKKVVFAFTFALACVLVSGCSSIVDGGKKSVKINSDPTGAKFTIYNAKGTVVDCETTPAKIKLTRSQGYFNGEEYKLVFEAPGFYTGEAFVKAKIDGWYFGNILFGGLIGLLVVDPLTGSMYTLSPRELHYTLLSTNLNINSDISRRRNLRQIVLMRQIQYPPTP